MQNSPFLLRILLVPEIQMMQLIVRVVLKPDSSRGRPLRMFLGDALLSDASELDLLPFAKLHDERTKTIGVHYYRRPKTLVDAIAHRKQVACRDRHTFVACALGVETEPHTAALAVLVAVAVARVVEGINSLRVQWDEAETVGDEFIGKDGAIFFDLD